MSKTILWHPVKRVYAFIESGKALGKPAYYACYEGMKIWQKSFGDALDKLQFEGYEINGFLDGSGARRYTMPLDELQDLYKRFENFVADCTEQEYRANKEHITAVYTLLHRHINAETYK